jgi:hypothetical protein
MYFTKEVFTDPNENLYFSVFKNLNIFDNFKPKINFFYNYDSVNYFG